MKKLQKEQLPKVIALGVVATGLLGYAAYSWLGGGRGGATPATAATPPHPASPPALDAADAPTAIPGIQLAEISNEDPFRPAISLNTGAPPKPAAAPPKPAAKPEPPKPPTKLASAALPDRFDGPSFDAVPAVPAVGRLGMGGPGTPLPTEPAAKPAPAPHPEGARPAPAPAKPEVAPAVVVTGILEGDSNVAILRWSDAQRQVVRVGDHLDGGFKVQAIRPDAVVLTRGSRQWVVRLGAEKPAGG
jgi:hypothetical protein